MTTMEQASRQMARPGAITGTSTPDAVTQRPQSPGNSIWMAETEWQSTPDSRHPVRYPLDATGQALDSGTHYVHPAPVWAMQRLTKMSLLMVQSRPWSHPLITSNPVQATTPGTNHGTSSNHHPSPVAHRRRNQAQPQLHYGTKNPFPGLGHARTSTWVIAKESLAQAQKATGPYGATRVGTDAPRSSVMAHLVECHFMVPTDIMGQNTTLHLGIG